MSWFDDDDKKLIDVLYKQASIEDDMPAKFGGTNRLDIARRSLATAGVLSGNRNLTRASLALRPARAAQREKELRMQTLRARGLKNEDIPRPIDGQLKTAGLFMKPSDLADHKNLASVLEGALSSSDQSKHFKKHAGVDPYTVAGAVVGAAATASAEYLRRQYVGTQDRAIPPPLPVEGNLPQKFRAVVSNAKDVAEDWARKNPMTSMLAAASAGAVIGGTGYLPKALKDLTTTISNRPPRP